MPNFAQEFPILIYLPLLIFTAVAAVAALTHLAVLLTAKAKSRRLSAAASRRNLPAAATPTLDASLPLHSPLPADAPVAIRLVSAKI